MNFLDFAGGCEYNVHRTLDGQQARFSFHPAMCASCLNSDLHAPVRVILLVLQH